MDIWFVSILLLFVISQTNLILKEETPRVYQVSFILDGEDESKYANLKKGVDDAAKKYNIDINLITLNNISQKMLIEWRRKTEPTVLLCWQKMI